MEPNEATAGMQALSTQVHKEDSAGIAAEHALAAERKQHSA
jgi:hypothetical protein